MDVQQETVTEFAAGTISVGTSAATLPRLKAFKFVKLKANSGNAGVISVGAYQLLAGEELEVPVDRADKLRIVASQASQRLHWIVA